MGTPSTRVVVVLLLFLVIFLQALDQFSCEGRILGNSNISCIASERQALLKFRQGLTDESNRLASWVGDDCCAWKGVVCSKKTSHVVRLDLRNPIVFDFGIFYNEDSDYAAKFNKSCLGGDISLSILDLKHLHYLDLSMNNFTKIQIPKFLGSIQKLRYLNLSGSNFEGNISGHLGNLSRLQYLDLNNELTNNVLTVDNLRWVSKLSSLKHLDLSGVDLTEATDWLQEINMLSSLSVLKLAYCELPGTLPPLSYVNITSLSYLDLSLNRIQSTIPLWVSNISDLVHLDLSFNSFYGPIPDSLGRFTSLIHLDLSFNKFNMSIPTSLGNLSSLVYLNLNNNGFQGNIPSTIKNLCSLRSLDLSENMLSGEVPSFGDSPFGCLKNLEILRLNWNSFHGPIPTSLGRLSHLRELYVRSNQLNGSIPLSLGQLSKLERLDISANHLVGMVSELHFSKLTKLTFLSMSPNLFDGINITSQWIPPFQLQWIDFSSIKVGPRFPLWLQTQRHVEVLLISNASISDTIPDWFEKVYSRISLLDLSRNNISGKFPTFIESNSTSSRQLLMNSNKFDGPLTPFPSNVQILDLSNNSLSGHIPIIQNATYFTLKFLILSNNNLSGEIPLYFCEIKTLHTIDLSRNQLSGRIPFCLGNLKELHALDLTDNDLYGEIPSSLGSLSQLIVLLLHNNKFCGKLPSSLRNLTQLNIIDLSKNEFADIIPPWIGENLIALRYFSVQSNKFYGSIPSQLCWLSALRVLDVAQNNITGKILECFENFTGMIEDHIAPRYLNVFPNRSDHGVSVLYSVEGIERSYTKTLPFLVAIDLSNNRIDGNIPEELMGLTGLWNLNLAGNRLKGIVPEKIGNLKKLEHLDLSRNQLSGSIPQSLSNLNSLSHLNLSFNILSGRVPTGNQLQTLNDPSIYMGNDGLCGAPLLKLKSCPGDESSNVHEHVDTEDRDGYDNLWFYAGIGPGFFVGFLGVCTTLHFKESWRYALFGLVENIYDKLFLAITIMAARLRRKFHKSAFGG